MKLLKIADRAYKIEIEKTAVNNKKLKINLNSPFRMVTIEQSTKGTLKAIEAAVIFLFPATPLRSKGLKILPSS